MRCERDERITKYRVGLRQIEGKPLYVGRYNISIARLSLKG